MSESGPLGHITPPPKKTGEKRSLEMCGSPYSFCSAPIFLRLTLQTLELEAGCGLVWPSRLLREVSGCILACRFPPQVPDARGAVREKAGQVGQALGAWNTL